MTDQELFALGVWIDKHVIGRVSADNPCRDDAAAMEVLRKITTKTNPRIINCGTCFYIEHGKDNWKVKGKTLPLAIAKFAKQLYREQKGEG